MLRKIINNDKIKFLTLNISTDFYINFYITYKQQFYQI